MIPYLLHISILVGGAYLFYKFLLEKETFFQLNRWVLLGGILLTFTLPFLQVPAEWSLQIAETKADVFQSVNTNTRLDSKPIARKKNSKISQKFEIDSNSSPAKTTVKTTKKKADALAPVLAAKPSTSLSWKSLLFYIYLMGLFVFALHFVLQLALLCYHILTQPAIKDGNFLIVQWKKDKAPYSFWNRIFMNPSKYDEATYRQILQHEKIHIAEKHSLDILVAELLVIVLWFNPFAWLYRKAVENNLEYLTDQKMLTKGNNPQDYQMSLLKVAVPGFPLNLTSNYNQSFLKKRILMMNSKKSSLLHSIWKYLFILPIFGLSILCLNAVKSNAESNMSFFRIEAKSNTSSNSSPTNTTKKLASKDLDQDQAPAEPIIISSTIENTETVSYSGSWTGRLEGEKVCMTLMKSQKKRKHSWHREECFAKNKFSALPMDTEGGFEISGDAGTIEFKGRFKQGEGLGTFVFLENKTFVQYLQQEGFRETSEDLLFHLTLSGVDKAYLANLKKEGYKVDDNELELLAHTGADFQELKTMKKELGTLGYRDIALEDLLLFQLHEVSMDYVDELRKIGFTNLSLSDILEASIHDLSLAYFESLKAVGLNDLSMDDLLQFAIHDIQPAEIKAFRSMGFRDMSTEEILQAGIHDVTPEYFDELKAVGLENLSMEEITQFAIHDIQPVEIKAFRSMGFRDLSTEEILEAGIHDVTPEYFDELKAVGLENLSMEEITQFAIHDIQPAEIKAFRSMGFRDMSTEEILQAGIHDVTPKYFDELKAVGLEDLSMEDIIQFAIHDVTPASINEFKNMGFRNLNREEILEASIHDVNASFIRDLNDLGFKDIPIRKLVELKIHNVDAAFIKKQQAAGKTGLTLEDYLALRIHAHQ